MTVNKRIPIHCITGLLTGQQFVDLLPAIELLTDYLIFIGLTSHVILTSAVIVYNIEVSSNDVVQILVCLINIKMAIFQTSIEQVSGKSLLVSRIDNFEKMKVYNKSVIDWFLGQQQYCLTLERICCSNPVNNCILLINTAFKGKLTRRTFRF